jgi:hypothetical protein
MGSGAETRRSGNEFRRQNDDLAGQVSTNIWPGRGQVVIDR